MREFYAVDGGVGMYKARTPFFVGDTGSQKSMFQEAIGRFHCRGRDKPYYIAGSGNVVDPLGCLTKAGEVDEKGCFCGHDAKLVTLQNTRLNNNDLKNLFKVYRSANLPGRYHVGIIPAGMPRNFSCNMGKIYDAVLGSEVDDAGAYFDDEGVPSVACMARENMVDFRGLTDDERAIARNVVVFNTNGVDFGHDVAAVLDDIRTQVDEERARDEEFWAKRRRTE